jgi:hypothetical protein
MARRKGEIGKLSGLNVNGEIKLPWRKFKERLDKYDIIPVNEWKAEQALGHILSRFKKLYGFEYALSYSGAPCRCSEIYQTKRMITALGTEDYQVVKDYIDWVYDKKIIPDKITIISVGFFFTGHLIQKFKSVYRKLRKISRTTQLPSTIGVLVSELSISALTYGDLAFAKMAVDNSPEDYPEYKLLFQRLKDSGFDTTILDTLEG